MSHNLVPSGALRQNLSVDLQQDRVSEENGEYMFGGGGGSGMLDAGRPSALSAHGHSLSAALRALLACGALALAIALLGASSAQAQDAPSKILLFHGPADATTDAGVAAIEALGDDNDFEVDPSADASVFTAENLAGYKAVVFLNTAGDHLNAAQESAFQAYVEGGGGFVGIGSTAQAESGAFFDGLIGARPAAGSSIATTEQTVAVGDRVHPATRDLPLLWNRSDVWYSWETQPTGKVHTVARYRPVGAPAGDALPNGGSDQAISWCKDIQKGRSFYTGMGRTAAAYSQTNLQEHLLGAIQWSAGLVRGGCKATIDANYRGTRIVQGGATSNGLAFSGESHGVAIAPNGWVFYINRGDCRTDQERGDLFDAPPFGRILNHADPNVGIGCGSVHIWDPAEADGTLNSGITRAGTLAVYGDGGTGGERTNQGDHKMEYGLLGVTAAPDFMQTGHIYLQYFPSFNPNSSPPGLGIDRRISKMSRPRISRFTVDLETKQLDLDSEVRIFEYDAQIFSCCHVGGGMGFDSEGNLYVTTGDTNSSQGTGGYSGNNPTPKCPTGPADEASSQHCGSANYSYQDARRTAGNTNDYNGKMLRFKPIASIADGTQPTVGVGTTYTLPTASSPNGPNLFDGSEGGGGKAKPEIYAMGLRNPSRLSIDPETDVPYSAWVGPDAGGPSAADGPSTYESAAQISSAGNYGWPYCMANGQAYRDRVANGSQRTSNEPGYVSGGPATGGTNGWYDCDNIVNDSPNNTGLTTLPHQTGTGKDAGKMRHHNLWVSRGNPGGNGCPDFPRDRGATNAPNYGATNTELCPYADNNGMTIMNGPVYRYDDSAGDDSRRWPEYWDGRWFLHNHGGPSVKHGLLLDPDTDQNGGQAIYADSLRNALSWQSNYMDSKFGPDGALYVQVYDGFFRANANVGLYRFDYIGGPDTPFANPTGTAIGSREVRFSSAGSGGVSYEWDFGDDSPVSTEANPTHEYAAAGEYTAKLTVTYADGEESVKEIEVTVLSDDDETAPVTTAALDPAQPGPGGTYARTVTVTLNATDAGGTGVAKTEYKLDGGAFQTYAQPFRVSSNGPHTIEYRSTDGAGNEEATKTVSFTIERDDECDTNLNDEFDGTTLDPKWQILRDNPAGRSVSGGRLHMLVRQGDMIAATNSAQNVLLQDAPEDGTWAAITKLDVSDLEGSGEQAGLIAWESEDPNNFAKILFIHKPDGQEWFEYVLTTDDATQRLPNTGGLTNLPDDVYIRLVSNGEGTLTAEYSLDGEEWTQIGDPITELGTDLKVGLKVSAGADSPNAAHFDYFHVDCSDMAPPSTTATVTPDTADGGNGWYRTPPQVTLEGDDGSAGSGVARIEYRIGTSGVFQTYDGPVTVSEPGRHTVQYRSVDVAGNEETPKSISLAVDPQAPTTTESLNPAPVGNSGTVPRGPVTVTLNAGDGNGAGVERTEYRVDGGAWKAYAAPAAEETIFDGTQASLDQWRQAPGGSFALKEDGSIESVGGLGMLWYPVKAFGDFSLKLQYLEARTDSGWSNGGVFVRFPDPRIPLADRPQTYTYSYDGQDFTGTHCSRVGAARTDEAWVAINCGHEIQVNDNPGGGEPQKTGSVYNFQPLNIEQAKPGPREEWTDYEIRVVGQRFTIIRDGQIINEFDNAVPRNASRAGDPPTQARQFAEGYIGLQNHGGSDKIRYRNVRVTDLAARSGSGPFTVSGNGNHTVEFRSTDGAGNVEAKKSVTFRIGAPAQPPQPSPPGGTPTPPGGNPNPPAGGDTPATFRVARLAKTTKGRFTSRGLKVKVTCTGAMSGSVALKVTTKVSRKLGLKRNTTLARKSLRCARAGSKTVTLKPSAKVKRALKKARGSIKTTLEVRLKASGQRTKTTRRALTLRRR
jgi:PKD repeat protein/glucose/arabinose dehydrogenase/type 1 glutamine amidotransferase